MSPRRLPLSFDRLLARLLGQLLSALLALQSQPIRLQFRQGDEQVLVHGRLL
jgi:hypothetical protein